MIVLLRTVVRRLFEPVESLFNLAFGDRLNPFYHLGALSFYFFWIVGASGFYLYFFFETSIANAYNSIEYLTHEQWYFGGVMRSLHRYCSDALAITVTVHLFREFYLGRFTGVRWFSWFSGVPILWLMFAAAIGGYWLMWDQFAQYVAINTMEWLDWLPTFGDPMARNFLSNDAISDRFFSFLVFLHIGIPLAMLLGMFIHIKRISNAKSNPPKELAIGTLLALVVLSALKPALSAGPADLGQTQFEIPFDWIYLNLYPLMDTFGTAAVWYFLLGLTGLLLILPWLAKEKQLPVAEVNPEQCGGCGWCAKDCPYDAIDMQTHPTKLGHQVAVVNPDLCTVCGICEGACPSATPFQHVDELVSGIELPGFNVDMLKQTTLEALTKLSGAGRVLVYGCDHGANISSIDQDNVVGISLPCIGLLPPSFVDFILRKEKADGVFVTGCCGENCFFRRGNQWTEERFAGKRLPHIRTKTAKDSHHVHVYWAGPVEQKKLANEIASFQKAIITGEWSKDLEQMIPLKEVEND